MKIELSCFIALAATFLFSMLIAPLVIKTMKKLKAGQVILGYVSQHSAKEGTPTMGGFIFIIPVAVVTLAVGYGKLSLVAGAFDARVFACRISGRLSENQNPQ